MIVVWFSCGAASAVAAKKTIEKYGEEWAIRIVNNPVKEEDPDNQRFLKDVEKWIGINIESALNSKYPECSAAEVWEESAFMSGNHGAPCTVQLKKEARYQWEDQHHPDYHVMGFTYDERHRHERFIRTERENVIPVLIEESLTKDDCFRMLIAAGIELPASYRFGFPNANCQGCVKASSPTYWNLTRIVYPEAFKERAEQSRRIGCKLARVKGKRIFLDELSPDAKGRPMKSLPSVECGIFCEEKPRDTKKTKKLKEISNAKDNN